MKKNKKIYQPEFEDDSHRIKGHPEAEVYSFQVWRIKKNLLKEYPNCTPISYQKEDIEEPTYMD